MLEGQLLSGVESVTFHKPLIDPIWAAHETKSIWVLWGHPVSLFLCELVAEELLRGQLGLLVDLSQHLMHHAEQRTAQAQKLIQEHIVMGVAPDVGPHSCERLTHTFQQPSRPHTHSSTSMPGPDQASPKQGNQGTWGLNLDAACSGADSAIQWWGLDVAVIFLQEPRFKKKKV